MKKALFVLMAIAIAAPAMAVDIQLVKDDAAKTVTVNYINNGTTATTRARAFALTVTVVGGATITGVSEFPDGTAENSYRIYPGSIAIDTAGAVTSYGTPVEPNNLHNSGVSAVNSKQVILAMGSLYTGSNAPAATGKLCKIQLSALTADATVTVAPEVTYRGGVVAEDANALTVASQSVTFVSAPAECVKATASFYNDWVNWNKPDCWCFQRQCRGDLNNAAFLGKYVSSADLTAFKAGYNKSDTDLRNVNTSGVLGICADLNHAAFLGKRVGSADLTEFKKYYNNATVPVCDMTNYNFWK